MANKRKVAVYPGTFDPVTLGHLDILKRASILFDEVIIAVAETTSKTTLFTMEERVDLLRQSIHPKEYKCPVNIDRFTGLLVDYVRSKKATILVRGIRAVSDFEYEFQMALMNRHLAPEIETVYLMPDEKFVYLSSSLVRVVGKFNGNLKSFLPPPVLQAVRRRYANR